MEKRKLGRTGLDVSLLTFGCGAVGGLMTKGDPADQTRAVQRALELGINFFDTAPLYGNGASETNVGRIFRELKPDVVLGTKVNVPPDQKSNVAAAINQSIDESLKRLQRDHVDLLQLHNSISPEGRPRDLHPDVVLGEVVPGMSATMVETGPDGDDRRVVVIRADSTGHFTVRATINGHTLPMLVDTGATAITLSYEDAERIGIDVGNLHFSLSVHTANGIANAAEVRLRSLSVGEIEVKGLRALVTQPGAMRGSLLGMNFLRSLGSYEVRGDRMYLRG